MPELTTEGSPTPLIHHAAIAAGTLKTLSDASPIPYVKVVAGVSLLILETVKSVKTKKEECAALVEKIDQILGIIIEMCKETPVALPPMLFKLTVNSPSFDTAADPQDLLAQIRGHLSIIVGALHTALLASAGCLRRVKPEIFISFKSALTKHRPEGRGVARLAEQSWMGRYVLDFGKLLAESTDPSVPGPDPDAVDSDDDPNQPGAEPPSSAVVLCNQDAAIALVDSAAAQFLQERSFRGLEARVGEDASSVLEQGRSRTARGYEDDHRK
ncbi:hypothetical protein DFH07DRAFT_992901 [Mycena maculata]|uniref:Uncharacterized protein n=1 Tax=Mycena maculata TaxID=230809 RepID=A0AAD7HXZ8_9AGAR|nr:hypothetical protein DFH07DRAFT_992901 [Mycena maculata]